MAENIAIITCKGRVTIPKAIHQSLGIQKRDRLFFVVEGKQLRVVPLHRHPLSELHEALPATQPYPGHQAIRNRIQTELGERIAGGET